MNDDRAITPENLALLNRIEPLWRDASLSMLAIGERLGVSRSRVSGLISRERKRPGGAKRFPARPIPASMRLAARRRRAVKAGATLAEVCATRARKAGDERFAPRPKVAAKFRKLKPIGEAVGNARPSAPPPSKPRTIEYLEIDECRWPVGQTAAGRTTFCGRKALQYPYCIDCAARAKGAPGTGAKFALRAIVNRPR